jgi:hypothetical protein
VLTFLITYDYIIRVVPHLYKSMLGLCRLFSKGPASSSFTSAAHPFHNEKVPNLVYTTHIHRTQQCFQKSFVYHWYTFTYLRMWLSTRINPRTIYLTCSRYTICRASRDTFYDLCGMEVSTAYNKADNGRP